MYSLLSRNLELEEGRGKSSRATAEGGPASPLKPEPNGVLRRRMLSERMPAIHDGRGRQGYASQPRKSGSQVKGTQEGCRGEGLLLSSEKIRASEYRGLSVLLIPSRETRQ